MSVVNTKVEKIVTPLGKKRSDINFQTRLSECKRIKIVEKKSTKLRQQKAKKKKSTLDLS